MTRGGRYTSKIRHVVVPVASNFPALSVIRPSAVPMRRPRFNTMPSALINPVSVVIGLMSEILNSTVVWPAPFSRSPGWFCWMSPPAALTPSHKGKSAN